MAAQSASSAELVTSLRFASNPRANFFDPLLQFGKVRPRPIDLFAARTAAELVVIDFGERLEFVDYVGLGCLFQRRVASQAPGERRDQLRELKTAHYLNGLFVGVLRARVISVLNDRVHKQTPITRQERSIFSRHHLEQLLVIGVFVVSDVEAEETKIAGEPAQMSISNKSAAVNCLQSFLRVKRATILDWKDLYFCVVGQRVIKTDCLFTDQDQINLRVRNAARLNDIFYGGLFGEPPLDYCVTSF